MAHAAHHLRKCICRGVGLLKVPKMDSPWIFTSELVVQFFFGGRFVLILLLDKDERPPFGGKNSAYDRIASGFLSYCKQTWMIHRVFSSYSQEPLRVAKTVPDAFNRLSMIINNRKQVYKSVSWCGVDQMFSILKFSNLLNVHDFQ